MALTIEDGTAKSDADSYMTEAELTTYATDRGITISGDTEELLIKAMDFIEGLSFKGLKYTDDQALQWPRVDAYKDGYLIDADEIPTLLKEGLAEVALAIDDGTNPLADIERLKEAVSAGPVSVKYTTGQATTIQRKITNKLYKLLDNSIGGNSFTVVRG